MKAKALSLAVLLFTIAAAGINSEATAQTYPLQEKLQQCETAFKNAHSGKVTQAEAAKARQKHMKLVREILQQLNMRNTELADKGEPLSQKEILQNLTVMGRLLEMLAADHQAPQTDWSYAY